MKCPYCDAEYTYQQEDIYKVEQPEHCRVVNCPVCGKPNLHRERMGTNPLTDTMHC